MSGVTAALARFAAEGTVPPEARHAGRRTILNALALGIGASGHPAVERLRDTLASLGGTPRASLLGRADRMPAPWAALVNGAAVHVEDFDDTHLATIVHPGAPVVPAALATAEQADASTEDLLDAVCVGVEVALRVALGMCPPHFDRGWHPTGTMGVIGAAVASARILHQDADQMRAVLGVAATQSAGLLAQLGTMTKSFHPGKAAANGLEAAMLVARGFTAPASIIEGRRGLSAIAGYGAPLDPVLRDLGARWELEANAFKPYACGIVSHPVLDAGRELRRLVDAGIEWQALIVHVNPVVLDVMGVTDPQDHLASKFSVYHCVALGVSGMAGGPESFTTEVATDPAICALRSRVEVRTDPSIRRDEARLAGVTVAGERHEVHVEHATGSAARPLTDAELAAKARLVAEPVLGAAGVDRLVAACLGLGSSATPVVELVETTRPDPADVTTRPA